MTDSRRYHGLDALRGSLMMLGIVLHGAFFYLADPPATLPIPGDGGGAFAFDLVFHFIHSFRIPAFFVLAGFFAALLVEHRGMVATFRNRAARVGVPLLLAMLVILPVATLFMLDFVLAARYGAHDLIPQRQHMAAFAAEMHAAGIPKDISLGHLWFLYYLCWFYLLIPAIASLVRGTRSLANVFGRVAAAPAAIVPLAAVTAATLWPHTGGQLFGGFIYLKPHLPSLAYYAVFFVVGYLVHSYPHFLLAAERGAPRFAAAATLLFPVAMYATRLEMAADDPSYLIHLLAVTTNALCTWALIYACIGAALRYFDHDTPSVAYVARSAYWVFLVHMPVAAFTAWWLVRYDLPVPVKFALVVTFTTIVCFTTYHYLVQRSWISVLLNGRRFDMAWPWHPGGEPARP